MGKRRKSGRQRSARGGGCEWIGGRLSPPFFITDRDDPYRIAMVLWLELPSGLVVGQGMVPPEETDGALGRVLSAALRQPLAGPPRRPNTIRVADAGLAAEVRSAIGDKIPITVAPTPELDQFLDHMLQAAADDSSDESYLGDGRVSPAAVAQFFRAAETLYRIAPWKVAGDHQIIRLDIPALDVRGACLSIIGNLGESLGLIVFPSVSGYEAFCRISDLPQPLHGNVDLGTDWLALNFGRGTDFPESMRSEAEAHGWPVAGDDAWPRVERRERDGALRPLVQRDVDILAATASALPALFVKHREAFLADRFEPISESYFDENELEVRFTLPYEAFELLEGSAQPRPSWVPAGPQVGRNDPCPCGSGRKYKKCHLGAEDQEQAASSEHRKFHDLDNDMVAELLKFGKRRFGDAWDFFGDFADPSEAVELVGPWAVYHYRIEGTSVLEQFLKERGRHLPSAQREWLASQQAAWLSVWEVTAVQPGSSVTVCDLLSGETRVVQEATASQALVPRDTVLARVVDHAGISLLAGLYPRALPPLAAAEVVRRARGRLRRKRAVPVERLRDEPFGRYLIKRWEEAVRELDERPAMPQRLRNTDGHELLLTTDHFKIAPGARRGVEAQIAAMEGVEPPLQEEDPPVYVFVQPGSGTVAGLESTLIGQAELTRGTLKVQTNSSQRADALRQRLESACGDKIRHHGREHTDPLSSKVTPRAAKPPDIPPEEMARVILEFKDRHYAGWIDESLPALNGKTPRQAARTAAGRAMLDPLLKDMEHTEQRLPAGQAFDFSGIRRQLRLD